MTLTAYEFSKLRTQKTWLGKCVKSLAWDDPSKGNMVNRRKHCFNMTPGSLPYSLRTVKVIQLEKVTRSDMASLKTFR